MRRVEYNLIGVGLSPSSETILYNNGRSYIKHRPTFLDFGLQYFNDDMTNGRSDSNPKLTNQSLDRLLELWQFIHQDYLAYSDTNSNPTKTPFGDVMKKYTPYQIINPLLAYDARGIVAEMRKPSPGEEDRFVEKIIYYTIRTLLPTKSVLDQMDESEIMKDLAKLCLIWTELGDQRFQIIEAFNQVVEVLEQEVIKSEKDSVARSNLGELTDNFKMFVEYQKRFTRELPQV